MNRVSGLVRESGPVTGRGRLLPTTVLLLLLLGCPEPVSGQQQDAPLRKSDVVLLLTSEGRSAQEIAVTIRARCLTFEPTASDLADFRRLGATAGIIEAILTCEADAGAGGPPEEAPPARPPPLRLGFVDMEIDGTGRTTFRIWAGRGGEATPGVPLAVRLSGTADPEAVLDRSTTASSGIARLTIPPAGATLTYVVRAEGGGGATAELQVDLRERSARYPDAAAGAMRALPGPRAGARGLPEPDLVSEPRSVASGALAVAVGPAPEPRAVPGAEEPPSPAAPEEEDRAPGGRTGAREGAAAAVPARDPRTLFRRADTLRERGELHRARATYRRARAAAGDPELARRELRELRNADPALWGEVSVWTGGSGGELDYRTGVGIQRLKVAVWPAPGSVGLWYEFDDGLNLGRPELVRGPTMYRSHYGGASFRYGGEHAVTRVVAGRRSRPPGSADQTILRLEQTFLLGSRSVPDFGRTSIRLGGTVGLWDADVEADKHFSASLGIPVTGWFRTELAAYLAEGIGTVPSLLGFRDPRAAEARFELASVFRSGGLRLALAGAYGDVASRAGLAVASEIRDRFSGSLWNFRVHGAAPLGEYVRLEGFYRWQDGPAFPSFGVFSGGISLLLPSR